MQRKYSVVLTLITSLAWIKSDASCAHATWYSHYTTTSKPYMLFSTLRYNKLWLGNNVSLIQELSKFQGLMAAPSSGLSSRPTTAVAKSAGCYRSGVGRHTMGLSVWPVSSTSNCMLQMDNSRLISLWGC